MPRFAHHKYTWSKPFQSVRHQWELVGPDGGVHFSASLTPGYGETCGLEFHHTPTSRFRCYSGDDAPHHTKCFLTGQPCWHDGTSLYASEHLWPMFSAYLRSGEHELIFRTLEREYDQRFGAPKQAEDQTPASDEETVTP